MGKFVVKRTSTAGEKVTLEVQGKSVKVEVDHRQDLGSVAQALKEAMEQNATQPAFFSNTFTGAGYPDSSGHLEDTTLLSDSFDSDGRVGFFLCQADRTETDVVLIGDIGGTNSRLRLFEIPRDKQIENNIVPGSEMFAKQYQNEHMPSFLHVVQLFFHEYEEKHGALFARPKVATFAVAGPVDSNTVSFTNRSDWVIDGHKLERELGIPSVRLINDFVANGYGVLTLQPSEVHTLQDVPKKSGAPIALLGAGTGLGECFLTASPFHPDVYDAWASEGGHTEFAPRSELEIELLGFLKKKFGAHARVSVERICSGVGISNVYEFLRQRFPEQVNKDVDEKWSTAGDLKGKIVSDHSKTDVLCGWAMDIFFSTYGSETGAVGLNYLCYGGLYIAGGIAPKNLSALTEHKVYEGQRIDFMSAFYDKGRVSPVLKQIPLHVVLADDLGQRGAHLVAFRTLRHLQ